MKEQKLYPEIQSWLQDYLKYRYKGYKIWTTSETHKRSLEIVLKNIIPPLPEIIGLSIKIDIVGALKRGPNTRLVFVEVKNKPLTLKDLGQLWGYTQLVKPVEAFLLSSEGLGTLSYILNVLKREDLLKYGDKEKRMMRVAKWDIIRKTIDYDTLIPKI